MKVKITPMMENIFMLLCLPAIWPVAFHRPVGTPYFIFLGLLALLCLLIFVRRIIRFRRLLREHQR